MPELTPTGAVDVVQRQVRRVRRRKNCYELQRAFYLTLALAAVIATVLLPVALLASTDAFATAGWSAVVILAGLVLVIIGATRRRWLARDAALAWIESRSALGGRVQTLVELAARPEAARGLFHGLLVAEVGRDLDAWRPARLVRRAVPRGALASALVATAVLAAVLRLASLASPEAPSIAFGDGPLHAGEQADATRREPGPGERIVVAPGVPEPRAGERSAASDENADDPSALTQLSNAVQERVRRQVWGKAWERVRDALARAATTRSTAESGDEARDGERDDELAPDGDDWEVAGGPTDDRRRRRPGIGRQPATRRQDPTELDSPDAPDAARDSTRSDAERTADADGGGGAGTGTDPALFGGAPVERGGEDGGFELALAARMRADRGAGGGGTDSGPPPQAAPDARPVLANDQRRETAAHRMTVPAAYEPVVREVFAHRDATAARASTSR